MLDLQALVRDTDRPVRLPHAWRVRIAERCALRCSSCLAPVRRSHIDPELVTHALDTIAPRASRVLFAGADPLTCRDFRTHVVGAQKRGLAVEVLTPGVLLTAERARDLLRMGVARVRLAVDNGHSIPTDRIHGGAMAARVGMPMDVQIGMAGRAVPAETLDWYATLPVGRVVLAADDCRSARTALPAVAALDSVRAAVRLCLSDDCSTPIHLDGQDFHERMVLEAIEDVAGSGAARAAESRLLEAPDAQCASVAR